MKRSRCATGRVQGDVAESDSVLVDTSVWVGFLGGRSEEVAIVTSLRRAHHIVICGQILQEVLQGSRDTSALAKLERQFGIWEYEAELPADFVEAARTYAGLRGKGVTVPPSDCLIAAVARRCTFRVCATDPHFSRIPGLRLLDL